MKIYKMAMAGLAPDEIRWEYTIGPEGVKCDIIEHGSGPGACSSKDADFVLFILLNTLGEMVEITGGGHTKEWWYSQYSNMMNKLPEKEKEEIKKIKPPQNSLPISPVKEKKAIPI